MLFIKTTAYFVLTITVLSSCSTLKVWSDFDTKTNFDKYKTFAYYKKGIKSVDLSDIDKQRILSAIDSQLKRKGYTNSKHPDLLVSIATNAEEYIEYGNLSGSFSMWPSRKRTFTKGVISIELIDYAKKKLVWQGTASGVLDFINTKEASTNKEKQIKAFVTEIMAKYPPEAE